MVEVQHEVGRAVRSSSASTGTPCAYDNEMLVDEELDRLVMTVPLEGGYANLRQFLQAVEKSDKFLVVERVALAEGQRGRACCSSSTSPWPRTSTRRRCGRAIAPSGPRAGPSGRADGPHAHAARDRAARPAGRSVGDRCARTLGATTRRPSDTAGAAGAGPRRPAAGGEPPVVRMDAPERARSRSYDPGGRNLFQYYTPPPPAAAAHADAAADRRSRPPPPPPAAAQSTAAGRPRASRSRRRRTSRTSAPSGPRTRAIAVFEAASDRCRRAKRATRATAVPVAGVQVRDRGHGLHDEPLSRARPRS